MKMLFPIQIVVQDLSSTSMITVGVLVEEKIPQIRTAEDGSMEVNPVLYIPSLRVNFLKYFILYKMDIIPFNFAFNIKRILL